MELIRTTFELDKALLKEAASLLPDIETDKDVIEFSLRELVERRKQKDLRDLVGLVLLEDDYQITYKEMRKDRL